MPGVEWLWPQTEPGFCCEDAGCVIFASMLPVSNIAIYQARGKSQAINLAKQRRGERTPAGCRLRRRVGQFSSVPASSLLMPCGQRLAHSRVSIIRCGVGAGG